MSAAAQNFKSQGEAGAPARETPDSISQALDFIEKVRNVTLTEVPLLRKGPKHPPP